MKLTSLQEKMHSSRVSIKSYFPVSSSMTTEQLCKTNVIENVAEQVSDLDHDLGDTEPDLLLSNSDVKTLKRKASTELPVPLMSDKRKISILENGECSSNDPLTSVDVSGIDYVGSNVEVRTKTCDIAKFRTELKDSLKTFGNLIRTTFSLLAKWSALFSQYLQNYKWFISRLAKMVVISFIVFCLQMILLGNMIISKFFTQNL